MDVITYGLERSDSVMFAFSEGYYIDGKIDTLRETQKK